MKKFLLVIIIFSVLFLSYEFLMYSDLNSFDSNFYVESEYLNNDDSSHSSIVNSYYKSRQSWETSHLGSILFKNVPIDAFMNQGRADKTFLILIWQHWSWLQPRHVYSYSNNRKIDPLGQCSVKNCIITGNNSLLGTADAVVVHIQKGLFPSTKNRKRGQRWIFLNDESPFNAFSMSARNPKLSSLANMFNWSMTYRSDSDVPVPYGRTVPLLEPTGVPVVPYWNMKQQDILAGILMSNCGVSFRMQYLNELEKYIAIDVHGKCSKKNKTSCPGHFRSDCRIMNQYLFYLVFENSKCKDYITEKMFYHAYSKGAIPVIMGPSLEDCKILLPPNSYLHVENFESPQYLAREMIKIRDNHKILLSFHKWRNDFEVLNEHGYFGSKSFHLCRICEALNYNDEREKIYNEDDLKTFLDPLKTCRSD